MTDRTKDLVEKSTQWGIDRGITGPRGKGTYLGQFAKFLEEGGELFTAICKGDVKGVRDASGDLQVVAIQACKIREVDILDEPSFMRNYMTQQDMADAIKSFANEDSEMAFHHVRYLTRQLGHDPDECLQEAYDVISKRTGKMSGGTFCKDG